MPIDLLTTRPAAVVFDIDGLLVDTEPCWTVAESELFARRGMPFGDEQKALLIGRSLPDACRGLAELFDEGVAGPALEDELQRLVAHVLESSAEAMEGAHDLVELVSARVPVAVASNSPRALVAAALRRGEFAGRFPVELCADDVANPKPAPDMYLEAARSLNTPVGRCLAFEDSRTGVLAAKAAGIPCVGVPSLPGVDLDADLVVASLADPALTGWVMTW